MGRRSPQSVLERALKQAKKDARAAGRRHPDQPVGDLGTDTAEAE
jgi:hypothetical protein